jgi:hypothetical protein
MTSFITMPAEIRLEVYSYIMPGSHHYPSAYTGLRNSFRLIRDEYSHEADKFLGNHPDDHILSLPNTWHALATVRRPSTTTLENITTAFLHPPALRASAMSRFPKKLAPWHWVFLKAIVIDFNMSAAASHEAQSDWVYPEGMEPHCIYCASNADQVSPSMRAPEDRYINKAVRLAFQHMDRMIKLRAGGSKIRRRIYPKPDGRPVECEVDIFVLRWGNFNTTYDGQNVIVSPSAQALPYNHDRLWDVTFGFADNGCFNEVIWRRRTLADAQRDAEDDFMPITAWLNPVPEPPSPRPAVQLRSMVVVSPDGDPTFMPLPLGAYMHQL